MSRKALHTQDKTSSIETDLWQAFQRRFGDIDSITLRKKWPLPEKPLQPQLFLFLQAPVAYLSKKKNAAFRRILEQVLAPAPTVIGEDEGKIQSPIAKRPSVKMERRSPKKERSHQKEQVKTEQIGASSDNDKTAPIMTAAKVRNKTRQVKEPEDKDSLGYALWLIFGEEKTQLYKAAENLNISYVFLSGIIRGKRVVTKTWLNRKNISALLEKFYPEGCSKHRLVYEKAVEKLHFRAGDPAAKSPEETKRLEALWTSSHGYSKSDACKSLNEWIINAGLFVRDIRAKNSKTIADLANGAENRELRDPQKWQSIEEGNTQNPTRLIKAAIRQTCAHCKLNERPDMTDYNRGMKLIESCP